MSGEVEGGGRRADCGQRRARADDEGQCRTADGEKFLLLFSNTRKTVHIKMISHIKIVMQISNNKN